MSQDDGRHSAEEEAIAASLLAALPDPVVVIGAQAELIWANQAAVRRFGWPLEELLGQPLDSLVHPDDHETAMLALASVAGKDVGTLVDIRIRDSTDQYAWFEVRGAPWSTGPEGAIVENLRETTDRHQWEVGMGDTRMLAAVLDAAPTITMLLEPDGCLRGANRALTRWLRRDLEGTLGLPVLDLIAPRDRAAVQAELDAVADSGETRTLEARLTTASGDEVPMSLTVVNLLADQAVRGLVVGASEITTLVEARRALEHLANHDDLTGLPNRSSLRRRLEAVLAREPRVEHTLVFGDIDKLKPINDRLGHTAGDAVLAEVGSRLRSVMREGDFVARVSGDEFVMIIPTTDPKVVADLEHRVEVVLQQPIRLPDGATVTVSMSTGTATTEATVGVDDLLAAADAAMYLAKRARAAAT